MTAIPAAPQDREILSLFREWIEAFRAATEIGRDDDLAHERGEACDAILAIEDVILGIPAQGPVGFAVKAYLIAHQCTGAALSGADPAGLPPVDIEARGAASNYAPRLIPLMRDAARFVPEIAELAAPLIGERAATEYGGNVVRLRPRAR